MSLTSYRAAPPRDTPERLALDGESRKATSRRRRSGPEMRACAADLPGRPRERDTRRENLSRPGNDLLSHVLRRSTIGAKALNGRVRDGTGCFALAMVTKPGKVLPSKSSTLLCMLSIRESLAFTESNQANRAISTGQLNMSPCLHLRPIDVVVFHGPHGIPCFEGGFPLRCLQRLSRPIIATLHCGWRHNRSTSGSFTPVLSY